MNKDKPTIILINPPDLINTNNYLKASELMKIPPVNILSLATYIRSRNPELNVIVKDYLVERYSEKEFVSLIRAQGLFLVGITTFSTEIYSVFKLSQLIKKINDRISIVLGGPHLELFPKETIEQHFVDFVCQGEGEVALYCLIERLLNNVQPDGIDNIWVKKDNKIVAPNKCNVLSFEKFEDYPSIDLDFIDLRKYFHPFLYKGKGVIPIITSRGCPFKCIFCNSSNKINRATKIASILDEIEYKVNRYNVKNVFIIDDTFNINYQRVNELSKGIIDRNIKIAWAFRGRVNALDHETLKIAKKSGLVHVALGIEDFSDDGLRLIKKGITVSSVKELFKICHGLGIKTTANFMVGFPHNQDPKKQIKLIDFIKELDPTTIQNSVLELIPGSSIYDLAVESKIISGQEWMSQSLNPKPDFVIPKWEEGMSKEEQYVVNTKINKIFYNNIKYLAKRFMEIRSLREFFIKTKVGLYLLLRK